MHVIWDDGAGAVCPELYRGTLVADDDDGMHWKMGRILRTRVTRNPLRDASHPSPMGNGLCLFPTTSPFIFYPVLRTPSSVLSGHETRDRSQHGPRRDQRYSVLAPALRYPIPVGFTLAAEPTPF